MFRLAKTTARLNGRVAAFGALNLPRAPVVTRQWSPYITQRASFATKKDDKADPPPPKQPIDHEEERRIGERKLEARPDQVSVASSTSNNLKTPIENTADGPIMQAELKHDMGIIKSTFSMENVPRESKILGLAGTLPYFATSLSTLYLSWDLRQNLPTGSSFFDSIVIDHGTAQYLLSVIEPVQLGYGAVIISFLGAIHWGLEYAETKPSPQRTRFRYGMGLAASIVAWPTLIMPVPYALTTQFLGFVGLYFADANAATRGWAPSWYGTYRFMLTAMVGAAILVSLIGRQKMIQGNTLTTEGLAKRLEQTGRADHETDWDALEKKEREKRRKEKEEKEEKEAEEKKKKAKKGGKKGKKEGDEGQKASSDEESDQKKDNNEDSDDEKDKSEKDESEKDKSEKDESEKDESEKDKSEKDESDSDESDNDESDNDESEKDKADKEEPKKDENDSDDSKDDGDNKSEEDGEDKDKSKDADAKQGKDEGQKDEKKGKKDKKSK